MRFRQITGRIFWGDNLSVKRGGVARISHVRGNPVIDENMVFATSHSGRPHSFRIENREALMGVAYR